MVAIEIENVVKSFPGSGATPTVAVDQVSLRIAAGELFFLLGPSGCGKTTLLRMVAGLVEPSSGRILLDGADMASVPAHRRDTAMVFQGYALWPHMTVAANVAFGLDVRQVREPERARRIAEVLQLVQMEKLAARKPAQLSGGQQQRVALARALAIRPRALLFDEPLSNLDAQIRLQMRSEIRRIVKQGGENGAGITGIYVTHDQKEALSMADRIGVMEKGKLVQVGTPAEIYRHPATKFVAGFIGESNFLQGRVKGVDNGIAHIETAAGEMRGAIAATVPVLGATLWLAIRPEAARVGAVGRINGEGRDANILAGRRISSTYLGEMAEHLIELAGGIRLRAMEMNPAAEPRGDALEVHIAPADVMIVAE